MLRNRFHRRGTLRQVVLFTLLGFLIGCREADVVRPLTPMPSLAHLIDADCVAPCWRGITPGQTDEATAVSRVAAAGHEPFIVRGRASITLDAKNYDYRTYFYRLNSGDTLDLALREGVVTRLQIGIYHDRPTLDSIVKTFGAPDSICSMDRTIPDTAPIYETHIVYRDRGIWLLSYVEFERKDDKAVIRPDMEIDRATFFAPREDLRLVMVQLSYPVHILDSVLDCLQRWKGFKSYEYYH